MITVCFKMGVLTTPAWIIVRYHRLEYLYDETKVVSHDRAVSGHPSLSGNLLMIPGYSPGNLGRYARYDDADLSA